jgi:hypothetical protein
MSTRHQLDYARLELPGITVNDLILYTVCAVYVGASVALVILIALVTLTPWL